MVRLRGVSALAVVALFVVLVAVVLVQSPASLAGTATRLVVVVDPGDPGASLLAGLVKRIEVKAVDAGGAVDTSYTGLHSITFSGASSVGLFAPSVTDSSGIAQNFTAPTSMTFTNGVSDVGGAQGQMALFAVEAALIAATDGTLSAAGADRLSMTVSAAPAARIAITGAASQTAGTTQNATLRALDLFGNPAPAYTGDKTLQFALAFGADSTGATVTDKTGAAVAVGSNTVVHFTAGVATGGAGVGGALRLVTAASVVLGAGDTGAPVASSPFDGLSVTVGAAAAHHLLVAIQPVGAAPSAALATQPVVRILDAFGNLASSTASVTAALAANPSAATLGGTATVAAVAGTATFAGLSVSAAGSGFSLAFSSGGLTGATSSTFDITATSCAAGSYLSGGSCVAASPGFSAPGGTEPQTACAAGSYSGPGAASCFAWSVCPSGFIETARGTATADTVCGPPPPQVIGVSPSFGPAGALTTITISGHNFSGPTVYYALNGVGLGTCSVTAWSYTLITCITGKDIPADAVVQFTVYIAGAPYTSTAAVFRAVQACNPGSYPSSNGTCSSARAGYFVAPGAAAETACPVGTYQSTAGQTSCNPANNGGANYTCARGQYRSGAPAGPAATTDTQTCANAGNGGASYRCPKGFYKSGSAATGASTFDTQTCTSGQYATNRDCKAGSYATGDDGTTSADASTCTPARSGHYADRAATGERVCAAGTYSANVGSISCAAASAGSFVVDTGATSATLCAPETFSAEAGSMTCAACPKHRTTLGKSGATACVSTIVINSLSSGGLCVGDGSLTLSYCPVSGIPLLTVTGSDFDSSATIRGVFAGSPVLDVTKGTITGAVGPQAGSNTLNLTVSGSTGDSRNSATVSFRSNAAAPILPPVITSLDSSTCFGRTVSGTTTVGFTACPSLGSSILVNGKNFFYTTTLTPGLCSNLYYVTFFQLLCLLNPSLSPGTVVNVQAFTPGMGQTAPTGFSIQGLAAPTITSVFPNYAPSAVAGSVVTIRGTNFLPSSTVTRGFASNVTWISATMIQATVSTGNAPGTTTNLVVTTLAGSSAGSPFYFDDPLASATVSSSQATTIQGTAGTATASVSVPAGALPDGTSVQLTPAPESASQSVPGTQHYVLSFQVSWQPTTLVAKSPVTLTVRDAAIKAGDAIWAVTSSGLKQVGTATKDGEAVVTFTEDPTFVVTAPRARPAAYRLVTAKGLVYGYGKTVGVEALPKGVQLDWPIVAAAADFAGRGGVRASSEGDVYAYSDVPFQGSLARTRPTRPIAAVAVTPSGDGYLLAGADGRVYPFGKARAYGSLAGRRLASPVVAIGLSIDAKGYLLVQANGAVHAFGDARTFSRRKGSPRPAMVVAIAPTGTGRGYLLVSVSGIVSAFGDAKRHGDLTGKTLDAPIVGLVPSPGGNGYTLVSAKGTAFRFGDARTLKAAGRPKLAGGVVAVAA